MKVTFAAAASGRSYFEKFLNDLQKQDKAIVLAVFKDIQDYGLDAKGCDFRQIDGKLWEIKSQSSNWWLSVLLYINKCGSFTCSALI